MRGVRAVLPMGALLLSLIACAPDGPAGPSPSSTTTRGAVPPTAAPTQPEAGRFPQTVGTNLAAPWGLAFLPDGSALVTVRDTAEVLLMRLGAEPRALGRVPGVRHGGEGGLLGIAVSPDFERDHSVFVYLTAADDNRVLRLRLEGEGLEGEGLEGEGLATDRPILTGIPSASFHDGGRLAFGPDGYLYVTTGDAGEAGAAQDPSSLGGKILRITDDGDPAPGNPFPGSPVWSLGHRNVQGIAWAPDGRMFASEFGQHAWDELNLIEPGGNYGWPLVEGAAGDRRFADPLLVWRPEEASPSGIGVLGGAIYVAVLRGEALLRVPLLDGLGGPGDPDPAVGEPVRLLAGELGRLRAAEPDPDGRLWLLTSNTTRGRPGSEDDRVLVYDVAALGG